jgi:hypothetical protein
MPVYNIISKARCLSRSTLPVFLVLTGFYYGQQKESGEGLIKYLNSDSTRYIKATGLAQLWIRYNYNNPGSTIFGKPQEETFDVGIRRARYQVLGRISERTFLYMQAGINNFNYLSARKTPLFFHDVTAEYTVIKTRLTLGAGLHGYNGTARYTSSATGSILGLDLPFVEEATNDISDQFVRKPGLYAKGKLARLDYKFSFSTPLPVQTALSPVASLDTSLRNFSFYNPEPPKPQSSGYLMWQFLEKESNLLPYMTGSYLGKKRIFNIGAGFSYQADGFWYRSLPAGDTVRVPLSQFAVDIFYDIPVNKNKMNAVTLYAAFLNYNFGPNYIRNVGIMNPTNGVTGSSSFNGTGNAAPVIGTGTVIYLQGAWLFKKDLLGGEGTLQPYFHFVYAEYERLKSPMYIYSTGINWLITGHQAKISIEYQDRPIFAGGANTELKETSRRGCILMQYQLAF